MTHQDPNLDPNVPQPPIYTETVETVVVRESNTGWWIAGILAGLVLLAVIFILSTRSETPPVDDALLQAQADAAAAQAQADAALINSQMSGAQASMDIARSDAVRSQAEAQRAEAEARAAEARAARPVVIEREVPVPSGPAVVTPTSPQN